jgi:nucleoside-diphosphate-sugar epimerase
LTASPASPASSGLAAPCVLLTGGGGYVGSALLPHLLQGGYRVRLLDVLLWGREPVARWLDHPNLELVEADFRDVEPVVRALRGADAVIHLGGVVGDPACDLDEPRTLEINVTATRLLAEAAKGLDVPRFIFASTGAVYGACDRAMTEDSPLNPVSLYARSKIAGEQILMELADESFAPTILRFGTIFGFSGRARFDLVINLLTAKALLDRQITVYGGNQWRSFVHVDDVANAVFTALQAPVQRVRNQVFNTGSTQQTYTILQIGELIHSFVPQAELIVSEAQEPSDYRIDCAKITEVLGYRTQWTVEDGIRQVMAAVQSGAIRDYRDERWSNVAYLRSSGKDRLPARGSRWAEELMARIRQETQAARGCEG